MPFKVDRLHVCLPSWSAMHNKCVICAKKCAVAMGVNVLKCNLMELTTKRFCVPLMVCGIVMHNYLQVHDTYVNVPSCPVVFWEALAPGHPLAVYVYSCSQRSSVVHMCAEFPQVCCSTIISAFEHSFWVVPH